jgi:hypothetical protein
MQEHFGAKDPGVKILSLGPPKIGKSPWSKNFEFGAKDPGVKSLSFEPQILNLGPPKWAKAPGLKFLSLGPPKLDKCSSHSRNGLQTAFHMRRDYLFS